MVSIRKGNKNDINEVCKLLIDTWKSCYTDFIPKEFLNNLDLAHQKMRHIKYLDNGANYFIALNHKNEISGFLLTGTNRNESVTSDREIYALYVKQDEQGNGIGTRLLERWFSELESSNSFKFAIWVSVFKSNPFKVFYLKNGFEKIGLKEIDMGKFNLPVEIYIKNL